MTEALIRSDIVAWAKKGARNEPAIHYKQIRPMPLTWHLPMTTDCSGFATLCYKLAGAPDPNGLHYNGQGYTGTMLIHMEHIPRRAAKPGDLLVWGIYPGHHVVILLEPGTVPDPLCCSHGQERGPAIYPISVEAKYQPAQMTFLRVHFPVPVLPPKPSPNPVSDNLNSNQVARHASAGGGGQMRVE